MSGMGDNPHLLELFREDVRANAQVLSDGLLGIEANPSDTSRIEPLMRAAHSIKGAARVVNVDAAVTLAHAAEDCLVAAQEGRISLGADEVDSLLKASDLLGGIAESVGKNLPAWLAASGDELKHLSEWLEQRAKGVTPAVPDSERSTARPEPSHTGQPPHPFASELAAAIEEDRASEYAESPMLELFRTDVCEAFDQIKRLLSNVGTSETSREKAVSDTLAEVARLLQSARSSARLVNARAIVAVCRAIEARLEEEARVQPSEQPTAMPGMIQLVELLQSGATTVGSAYSDWLDEHQEEIQLAVEGLTQAVPNVAGEALPETPAVPAIVADETKVSPSDVDEAPSERPPETKRVRSEPTAQPAPPRAEQVVRVTAQSLNRLMGLAGESLVEARWLQPFSKSLIELKRGHSRLAESIESLRQQIDDRSNTQEDVVLLNEASSRLTACQKMLAEQIVEFETRARNADELNSRLYHEVIASRLRPFSDGVQGFPRMVRDLARQLGKQVSFSIEGMETDVDRDILDKLEAPLNHLLRNALDHGLEVAAAREEAGKPAIGRLNLAARHNAGMLVITIQDDGRGINAERVRERVIERGLADPSMAARLTQDELFEFLFLPAFSTSDSVTEVSGRGVGLDVVHSTVHALGGTASIQSKLGEGTTFRLELPITLSVIRAVLVSIAGEPYAFPHNRIDRLHRVTTGQLRNLEDRQFFEVDGRQVGIVVASSLLELEPVSQDADHLSVVVFSHLSDIYGLVVDEFLGERDLVVRPLDARLGKVPNINAASLLDDGSPVLIVDLDDMRRSIERRLRTTSLYRAGTSIERHEQAPPKRILVVDDSITVREVQRQMLVNEGYEVEVAVDGMEGWNLLSHGHFDLVITDIDMPRMNGIDLIRRMKGDSQTAATPVVIVSYKDREEDRVRGMEAGADYYLTKSSFHDDSLLQAVLNLIGAACR